MSPRAVGEWYILLRIWKWGLSWPVSDGRGQWYGWPRLHSSHSFEEVEKTVNMAKCGAQPPSQYKGPGHYKPTTFSHSNYRPPIPTQAKSDDNPQQNKRGIHSVSKAQVRPVLPARLPWHPSGPSPKEVCSAPTHGCTRVNAKWKQRVGNRARAHPTLSSLPRKDTNQQVFTRDLE